MALGGDFQFLNRSLTIGFRQCNDGLEFCEW